MYSVVVWLTAEGYPGPGHNRLAGVVRGQQQLTFEFAEVRLWELDAEEKLAWIEAEGRWSLLPLVPLMGEEPRPEVLERAVEGAGKVGEAQERADVYTGIAVLGGLRYGGDLIRRLIREEVLMESPIYREILERGAIRAKREAILEVLAARFGVVPKEVAGEIGQVEDREELGRLVRMAARCRSWEEFAAELPTAAVGT
ncbi:MAG TPA: hypothetical protein EYP85_03885 [Armatimonadetes bacterium]|nr:hypothetical protein [Armatimonadota bacterium]